MLNAVKHLARFIADVLGYCSTQDAPFVSMTTFPYFRIS
jgi:hypothetical protein